MQRSELRQVNVSFHTCVTVILQQRLHQAAARCSCVLTLTYSLVVPLVIIIIRSHAEVCCPGGGSRRPRLLSHRVHSPSAAALLPDSVLSDLGHSAALHPLPVDAQQQRSLVGIPATAVQLQSADPSVSCGCGGLHTEGIHLGARGRGELS